MTNDVVLIAMIQRRIDAVQREVDGARTMEEYDVALDSRTRWKDLLARFERLRKLEAEVVRATLHQDAGGD